MDEWWDKDGYPSDSALNQLSAIEKPADALNFALELWNLDFGSVREALQPHELTILHANKDERFVRFATGGWSGNESIISALRRTPLTWPLTWRLSARGGLHIFEYPKA